MKTTFSVSSKAAASTRSLLAMYLRGFDISGFLECESSFAGGLRERLHAAVVHEPAAVEDDVANAFALVWLGWPDLANVGGRLADLLSVDAFDGDLGGAFDLELDARWGRHIHRMRITNRQHEVSALHLCSIADALELQCLAEAGGDAGDHICDQRAGEAMHRTVSGLLTGAGNNDLSVLLLDPHFAIELAAQFALGSLNDDVHAVDADLHPGRDGDRHFPYSRHRFTTRSKVLRRPRRGGGLPYPS